MKKIVNEVQGEGLVMTLTAAVAMLGAGKHE